MSARAPALAAVTLIASFADAAPFQNALLPAGAQAQHIHTLWLVMLVVCIAVFIAVVTAVAMALWRAPRSDEETAPDMSHMREREPRLTRGVAIALGTALAGLLFLMAASVLTDRALAGLPLKDGVVVEVTAHQFWWEVKY